MCDQPANTNGWMAPGTLHTVVVPDLVPSTKYYYTVGDLTDPVGTPATWSPEASFTAPPLTGPLAGDAQLRFIAFGDMGNADKAGARQHSWDYDNHGEINALNTTNRIIDEFKGPLPPSLVVHIGDIAYAVGYLSEWDQFLEQIRPIASRGARVMQTVVGGDEYWCRTSSKFDSQVHSLDFIDSGAVDLEMQVIWIHP